MKPALLLAIVAVALGAVGLYRYESTRTVNCGESATTPVSANVDDYVKHLLPANTTGLEGYKVVCQARIDAANGKAQSAYLAYAALVLLGGAACFLVARPRRPQTTE